MRIAYRICPRVFFSANCFGDGLARLRALDGSLEATYGTRVSRQKFELQRFRVTGELRLQDSGISLLGEAPAIAQAGAKAKSTPTARARRRLRRGPGHILGHQGAVPRRSRAACASASRGAYFIWICWVLRFGLQIAGQLWDAMGWSAVAFQLGLAQPLHSYFTVTSQLLHSYFTVTSQLLHSYFMRILG